jgi:hypothetical protein
MSADIVVVRDESEAIRRRGDLDAGRERRERVI